MTTKINYHRGRPITKFGSIYSRDSRLDDVHMNTIKNTFAYQDSIINNSIVIHDPVSRSITENRGSGTVTIGVETGVFNQGNNSVSVGTKTATYTQGETSIAIGYTAGTYSQGNASIAIGTLSGLSNQQSNAICIGTNAGFNCQSEEGIAIGTMAGYDTQGFASIAIGCNAGSNLQGDYSISIGYESGKNDQKANCIAIGTYAGTDDQRLNSIAIGSNVGIESLGQQSIVLGNNIICKQNNTICINTSDELLTAETSGLFIAGALTGQNVGGDFKPVVFNPLTKQIVFNNSSPYYTLNLQLPELNTDDTYNFNINYFDDTASIIYKFDYAGTSRSQLVRFIQTDPSDPNSLSTGFVLGDYPLTPYFELECTNVDVNTKIISLTLSNTYPGVVSETITPYATIKYNILI